MDLFVIMIAAVGSLVVYAALAAFLSSFWRLKGPSAERLEIELPTPGHFITLTHLSPDELRFKDPIVLCHGLGANGLNMDFFDDGRGSDRRSIGRALTRAGFDVWLLERRGHGTARVPHRAEWTPDDEVTEDVPVAIEAVLDQTGADKVFWVGHSWGGILMYLFLARGHPLVDRIRGTVCIGSPGTLDVQGDFRWVRPFGHVLVNGLGLRVPFRFFAWLGLPIVHVLALLPRAVLPRQAVMEGFFLKHLFASLIEDIPASWARVGLEWLRRGGFCDKEGQMDAERFGEIDTPMLLIAGQNDRLAPPATVQYVADRVKTPDVTFQVMGRPSGCQVDYGHGGLLVAREAPDEVYPVIRGWLTARAVRLEAHPSSRPPKSNGKVNGTSLF